MRWPQRGRTEVRGIIDRFGIYDHILENLRIKMRGAGAPCVYYHNSTRTSTGVVPSGLTRCYCYPDQQAQPDRTHFLCQGTGYLEGYQKYGTREYTISTTTANLVKDSVIIITGDKGSSFTYSSPTLLQAKIDTPDYTLDKNRGFDRFYANDATDPNNNRVRYFYSLDSGVTWIEISMFAYTKSKLANKEGIITLPTTATKIRFRILLEKRTTQSLAPKFNSIRFRYRTQRTLISIDPRYPYDLPGFLAAREQEDIYVDQGQLGWETKREFRWWTLPEVNIMNGDVMQFLGGGLAGQFNEVEQLMPHVHGPDLRLLHKSFTTQFIRDGNDVLKIVQFLS